MLDFTLVKLKTNSQAGFTVLEIALAFVAVSLLSGVGVLVYQRTSEQNAQKSGSSSVEDAKPIAVDDKKAEESKTVSVPEEEKKAVPAPPPAKTPPPPSTKKEESKPSYTTITVNIYDADVNASRVKLKAIWSGNYSGTCYFTVKNLTTSSVISKEVGVSNNDECEAEIPRSELVAGSYKFSATFKNSDYTVKGYSEYKTFGL